MAPAHRSVRGPHVGPLRRQRLPEVSSGGRAEGGVVQRNGVGEAEAGDALTLLTCGALVEVTPGGVVAPILRGEGSQAPTCWGRFGSPRAGPAPALPVRRAVWSWRPRV
ncbi:hypothetical protein GCM10014715_86690 [Streptomyces spiralis]|uniref:Uncharacterized protein n=1 Tax=Streptomyces spiralis TaxID=66376 RepID=A0A919AP75_9ACTN|nr:hypothetical protein GCM10014715_86690 [Streptomyces spiralis]